MTIFFQDLDRVFYIQDNKEEHITTIRSEAERVIDPLPCSAGHDTSGIGHRGKYFFRVGNLLILYAECEKQRMLIIFPLTRGCSEGLEMRSDFSKQQRQQHTYRPRETCVETFIVFGSMG